MRYLYTAVILSLIATPLAAAEVGNPVSGERIAKNTCANCHRVSRDQPETKVALAPPFHALANDPSVTSFRIRAFLQTPHRIMPNFILKAEETDDIVAYILSLKNNSGKP